MTLLPVMLRGEAIRALVVGGGAVATRRALALLDAGATVRVVAPVVSTELREAAAANGRLCIEARPFASGDEREATLVIAATDDRVVNARVAAAARSANCLVNVADAPDEGTMIAATVHRAGDLVVGVSAGGVPGIAARVRDAIAARFDGRYATAIGAVATLRRALLDRGDRERWARAARELAGPDFVAAVEDGTLDERVRRWA